MDEFDHFDMDCKTESTGLLFGIMAVLQVIPDSLIYPGMADFGQPDHLVSSRRQLSQFAIYRDLPIYWGFDWNFFWYIDYPVDIS